MARKISCCMTKLNRGYHHGLKEKKPVCYDYEYLTVLDMLWKPVSDIANCNWKAGGGTRVLEGQEPDVSLPGEAHVRYCELVVMIDEKPLSGAQ